MKAEQLIPNYLAKNGSITLQDIGTFTYSGASLWNEDLNKTIHFPEHSITFQFNPKAKTEDGFIQFIVTHTGKIRSLAAADLESHLLTGKQFLNIGKPLLIKDIGYLMKHQTGHYEFTQGAHRHEIIDTEAPGNKTNTPTQSTEKSDTEDIDFSSPAPQRKSITQRKWVVGIIVVILVIAGVATGIYNSKKTESGKIEKNKPAEIKKTTEPVVTTNPADTAIKTTQTPAIDTIGFDFVLKRTNQPKVALAFSKALKQRSLTSVIDSTDPKKCIVYIHFERKQSDTTFLKDSLTKKKLPPLETRKN